MSKRYTCVAVLAAVTAVLLIQNLPVPARAGAESQQSPSSNAGSEPAAKPDPPVTVSSARMTTETSFAIRPPDEKPRGSPLPNPTAPSLSATVDAELGSDAFIERMSAIGVVFAVCDDATGKLYRLSCLRPPQLTETPPEDLAAVSPTYAKLGTESNLMRLAAQQSGAAIGGETLMFVPQPMQAAIDRWMIRAADCGGIPVTRVLGTYRPHGDHDVQLFVHTLFTADGNRHETTLATTLSTLAVQR